MHVCKASPDLINFVQLFQPLNIITYQYKFINDLVVDAEKLIDLLEQPTEINDRPGAQDLMITNGEIEFGTQYPFICLSTKL